MVLLKKVTTLRHKLGALATLKFLFVNIFFAKQRKVNLEIYRQRFYIFSPCIVLHHLFFHKCLLQRCCLLLEYYDGSYLMCVGTTWYDGLIGLISLLLPRTIGYCLLPFPLFHTTRTTVYLQCSTC